jgi:hypothetical protein
MITRGAFASNVVYSGAVEGSGFGELFRNHKYISGISLIMLQLNFEE